MIEFSIHMINGQNIENLLIQQNFSMIYIHIIDL